MSANRINIPPYNRKRRFDTAENCATRHQKWLKLQLSKISTYFDISGEEDVEEDNNVEEENVVYNHIDDNYDHMSNYVNEDQDEDNDDDDDENDYVDGESDFEEGRGNNSETFDEGKYDSEYAEDRYWEADDLDYLNEADTNSNNGCDKLVLFSALRYDYPPKSFPYDSDISFCTFSPSNITKQDFAFKLKHYCSNNNVTLKGLYDLLSVFHSLFGGLVNIPNESDFHKYLPDDKRKLIVDVCPNNCTGYFDSTEIQCSKCNLYRYRACTVVNCKDKKACNPFLPMSHKQRIPHAMYYYRSIIVLLKELIEWSIRTDVELFNYQQPMTFKLNDILQGVQAIRNLREMNELYLKALNKEPNLIEHSLLLSEFYDGGKLFSKKAHSVWPLFVSILNIIYPSYRSKSGIGLHLIALHLMKPGSTAEKQMFKELLIPELLHLEKGILFTVKKNNNTIKIFLQARIMVHCLDTRALEKVAHVQTAGANAGCMLCNTMVGVSRKWNNYFDRVVYFGYRRLLPDNHWLRYCGMSKSCCPKGYYDNNLDCMQRLIKTLKVKQEEDKKERAKKDEEFIQPKFKKSMVQFIPHRLPTCTDQAAVGLQRCDCMLSKLFKYEQFILYVEPAHCDFRSQNICTQT